MVDNPGVLLDDFAEAGADRCTVHVELGDPRPLFDQLRKRHVGVGLVLNPPTASTPCCRTSTRSTCCS